MENHRLPYTLTEEMLNYVASIASKMGEMNVYQSLEKKPHLRRSNRIKSIHSSLKIEANSLSIGEVKEYPMKKNNKTVIAHIADVVMGHI